MLVAVTHFEPNVINQINTEALIEQTGAMELLLEAPYPDEEVPHPDV